MTFEFPSRAAGALAVTALALSVAACSQNAPGTSPTAPSTLPTQSGGGGLVGGTDH